MKELGLDLYPWALEKLRPRAVPVQTGVESPSFSCCASGDPLRSIFPE